MTIITRFQRKRCDDDAARIREEKEGFDGRVGGSCCHHAQCQAWYEEEVGVIENGFSEQLDAYEKELEVEAATLTHPQAYRATCFVKAEKKEEELDRELKGTPLPSTEPKTTRPSAPRAFARKYWSGITTS